eukprot:493420_1
MTITMISFDVLLQYPYSRSNISHFVRVKRRKLPDANFIFIPYAFEEREDTLIDAVSLFASLRGSNIADFIEGFFYLTFGSMFAANCMKWMEYKEFNVDRDIPIVLNLWCAYGSFFANVWNLERKEVITSRIMHYISTIICVICGPLALCLQQHWSILSIVLLIGAYVVLG